jgi:glucose-1-phosphate thymidylyltransferase
MSGAAQVWGIIPAAGVGSRIQPLAFSKELLPLGSRIESDRERPRAVSEYLIDRMLMAGVTRLCFVISPRKSDILNYFGAQLGEAHASYVVQPEPGGLCDAIFRAAPLVRAEDAVFIGLPDTVWFPQDGLCRIAASGREQLTFLLFPVEHPELFDAVIADAAGGVEQIEVKTVGASSRWVWGALAMPGRVLHDLHALWQRCGRVHEYLGTLVNAYLDAGGVAIAVRSGEAYVDVGTVHGYREAVHLLETRQALEGRIR